MNKKEDMMEFILIAIIFLFSLLGAAIVAIIMFSIVSIAVVYVGTELLDIIRG